MRTPIFTPSRTGTCTSFSWIIFRFLSGLVADHVFLRYQPPRGGVHLHEILLVLAHHRGNGPREHRADVLDLREIELRKAVEVRSRRVLGQREGRDDALHARGLDHLALEVRVLVQPVILELRVSQVAAPADGPDGFQLPRSPHRPRGVLLFGHEILIGEDLRRRPWIDEVLRVLAHRRGPRPRQGRAGVLDVPEIERHHAVERRHGRAQGHLAGGDARHDLLQRSRCHRAALVQGVPGEPVVLELGERQVRPPLDQADDLDPRSLIHDSIPALHPSAATARRRTAFSRTNNATASPPPAALIQRSAPKAFAGMKRHRPATPWQTRAANPRGRAAWPIIAAEMNQTPATARDRSTAIDSGSPLRSSVPENTKRKGITNSVQPKAMATQPVRLGSAPARFAATNAAIATGGEIIDRHP